MRADPRRHATRAWVRRAGLDRRILANRQLHADPAVALAEAEALQVRDLLRDRWPAGWDCRPWVCGRTEPTVRWRTHLAAASGR